MNLLKRLIIISLILFPFGELLRVDLGSNITIKPLDVLAGVITITLLVLVVTKQINKPQLRWYYLLFPISCLLSLIVNLTWLQTNQFFAAGLYLIRWVSYMGIFFAVLQMDEKYKVHLEVLLFICGLFVVLFGFIQFFFFLNLKPLFFLGWDDHLYRLFSVFLDPNFTGAILVLFVLFAGGVLYKTVKSDSEKPLKISLIKDFSISKNRFIELVCITMGLAIVALFFTFSRSSLLMLIVGASSFFVLIGRKKLILWLLSILAISILLISPFFFIENVNLFRQASTSARIWNYENAMGIIAQNPLFGVGFNAYRYAKDYNNVQTGWVDAPSHADAGVDNSFIFVFATTGFVGLSAYLILWFYLLKRAYRVHKRDKNIFAAVFISSSLGMFIHAMFINSLFFPAIMFWLWMVYGLMERR